MCNSFIAQVVIVERRRYRQTIANRVNIFESMRASPGKTRVRIINECRIAEFLHAITDIGRSRIHSADSQVRAMSTSAPHRFVNDLLLSFGRTLKVIIVKISNESVEYLFIFLYYFKYSRDIWCWPSTVFIISISMKVLDFKCYFKTAFHKWQKSVQIDANIFDKIPTFSL